MTAVDQTPVTLSVIAVNWNSWRDLERCITSIQQSSFKDTEIIVVDNASIDETLERLPQQFPDVRLFRNDANVGHTRGVNHGLRVARGRFILVIDPDAYVAEKTIETILDFFAEHPEVSLAAPRIFSGDGSIQEAAKHFPSVMTGLFGRYSLLTKLFPNNRFSVRYLDRRNLKTTEPFRTQSLSSACVFFRRELVDEIGLWDEGYSSYWVDTDWCMAAYRAGKQAYVIPAATAVHLESYNPRKRKSARRVWMFHMMAYRFYRKWHTRGTWDPRAVFAWTALALRVGLQLAVNRVMTSSAENVDAAPVRRPPASMTN